jgi:hypothetical protein
MVRTLSAVMFVSVLTGCLGGVSMSGMDADTQPTNATGPVEDNGDAALQQNDNADAATGPSQGATDMANEKTDGATTPPPAGAVARPSYNKGTGFFVLNGKLYDPTGVEFRIRGVNRNHFDFNAQPGISHAMANTVRTFLYTDTVPITTYTSMIQKDNVAYKELAIPTLSVFHDGTGASCNESTTELTSGVKYWTDNAQAYTALDKYIAPNLANEWGPGNSTSWRDAYKTAIASMRAAGYNSPLVIDAGHCGQDTADLLQYSTDVFNSDPQKNIIFSYHLYGGSPAWTNASMTSFFAQLEALSKQNGAVYIIGEFGPGKNVGPSPTTVTPTQVITAAESANLGWLPWAWDDSAYSDGFALTVNASGTYNSDSDLTDYGKSVVTDSKQGLKALAKAPNW